jgi:PAS domain S-box-containing protein
MDGIQPAELSQCLFTEANDAFFIFQPTSMRVLDANPTAQRLTGYGRKALLAMNLHELLDCPDAESADQFLQACDATTFFHSKEGYSLKCSSGPPLAVNVSVSRLHGDAETFGLLMVRDVTQRRRAEESLEAANRRLRAVFDELKESQDMLVQQERMRALGQMASGAAHDLNNLLSPLVSYTDVLLRRPDLTSDMREQLSVVATAAQDVAGVVKRLQLVHSPARYEREVLDFADLFYQARELTRPKWHDEAMKTGCRIVFEIQLDEVPPVQGNPSEIRQALMNLVFNAVESMPMGGKVTLHVFVREEVVCLEVTDTGVGMSGLQKKRCCDPFFTTKKQGSGLGLSVCHGIVHRHRGAIEFDSVAGRGTTVRLVLPIRSISAPELPVDKLPVDKSIVDESIGDESIGDESMEDVGSRNGNGAYESASGRRTDLSQLRVLYIDDDEIVRNSFGVIARVCGWQVDLAEDGRSGLSMLESTPYDVVITDFGMRDMSGKEVTRLVKQVQSDIAVIVISGWDESIIQKAFDQQVAKPDFLIAKPATLECLETALTSVRSRMEREESYTG